MITIHNANAIDFSNNGLGVLEPLSCILNLEINGGWSLEMEYPLDPDKKYLNLEEGNIIKVTGIGVVREQTDTYQLFRIYDVNKGLSSLKVIAFPVAFEASYDAVIENYTTGDTSKTLSALMSDVFGYIEDTQGIDKYTYSVSYSDSPTHTNSWKNTNLIAVIGGTDDNAILNRYKAEIAYDNYKFIINKQLGEDTAFEIRYGKNLTGLDVDIDTSGMITRIYPLSKEGYRYNGANNEHYINSDYYGDYPFGRCAFVNTGYALTDTSKDSHTDAAIKTRAFLTNRTADIKTAITPLWNWYKTDSGTHTSGWRYYEPEYVKSVLNDIIALLQEHEDIVDPDYVDGIKNLIKTCLKEGINWIKNVDIKKFKWVKASSNPDVWNYKNSVRTIHDMWYYVDRKWRWFDSNGAWHDYMDIDKFDWIQDKESNKPAKFGNNRRHFAHGCDIYTMNNATQTGSELHRYRFNEDGWWDGTDEVSAWKWHLNTDNNKWWFGKDEVSSNKDYAHDQWLYVYDTAQANPTKSLYYFDSDGYVVSDLTETVNWEWKTNDGSNWWFGSDNKEQRAVYLTNQWAKIDGDWCYFDNNGEQVDEGILYTELYRNFATTIIDNCVSAIDINVQLMYDALYAHMRDYCTKLYEKDGYDKPSISVKANVVDLSKTTEYKDFPDLMTIHLGDKVKVIDYVHYPDFEYNMRVVGLQYDCIREYNTQVTIGDLSKKVSQMISANLGGKGEQKLVAGENVTIDGNTINAMTNVGDIYAGSQVDVQQVVTSGTEIAKIYVDGYPTSIYASGADVQITRYQTEGTPVADIVVNGQHYMLYSDGLQYWHETSEQIWREGVTDGMIADDAYLSNDWFYYTGQESTPIQISNYQIKKLTDDEAIVAKHEPYFMIVSCVNSAAVDFVFRNYAAGGWGDWQEPIDANQYNLYKVCHRKTSFNYMGKTWWVNWSRNDPYSECPFPTISDSIIPPSSGDVVSQLPDAAKQLIDLVHGAPYRPDKEGISNQDHILFYNSYPDDPNHEDDVFVSKSGVFHGTLFEDAEGNPISGGGLSKTDLYNASSYAASITLASAYTGYQFLLIQTYNPDDHESLSVMLNVADLATGNRIGINDYLLYTITNGTTLTFYDSFDDTNHTRHIKGIYGLKTFNGSDVPNIITDVKDGDISVVSGGVAQIGGKQDTLIAGQNITIAADGKTISATGGTSSIDTLTDVNLTSLANGQILKYNSTSEKWENADETDTTYTAGANIQISANNEISATDTTYSAGANVQISANNEISATDTTYDEFDGTNSGLVPQPQSGDSGYLKSNGTWDEPEGTTVVANPSGQATADLTKLQVGNDIYSIPSGSTSEIVTDILSLDYQKTTISNSEQSFSWSVIQFEGYEITCNNNPTAPLAEMIWNAPISADVKKIRFKFEPTAKKMSGSDDYNLFIGVKSSFNTSSEPTDQDWLVSKSYSTVVNPIEDELSITTSADYYLYIIANGWDVDITKVESVEYASGGASDLVDLGDVDITTPVDGQVLTYNATSQKWENETPSGGGGVQTFVSTSDPSSSIGSNGDLYFKVSSSDKVQFAYVKVNGTWQVYSDNRVFMTWETLSNIRATSTSGRYNGQTATFKLTNFTDYNKLTADDIFLKWTKYYHSNVFDLGTCAITKTYDAPTGILTVTSDACLFYNGNYTIEAVAARGCIVKTNVAPVSSSGTTATFDISDVDGYASLTLADIALNLDSIYHTNQYNGAYTITYSYSSSGIITVQTNGSNILEGCRATIAIKKVAD